MPIEIRMDEVLEGFDTESGALDPEQVYVQFLCTTASGHDPDEQPDDHVRPAHAALHGRVFRLDAGAPIPPLDYGCRCAIRYVAKPGTMAERALDVTAPSEPEDSVIPAQQEWLDANAEGWRQVAKAASEAPPQERAGVAYKTAKRLGFTRDIAQLAISASPYPMRTAAPLAIGPLSGVGAAGRRLAQRWLAGDAAAGEELRRKYPATWTRLRAENPALV